MPRIHQLFARNTAWDSQTSGDDVVEYASGSATHLWILSGAATGNYMRLQQTEIPPKWTIRKGNLVGGIPTPLKNVKVSWGYYSQYMEKQKMFQTTNQKWGLWPGKSSMKSVAGLPIHGIITKSSTVRNFEH